MAQRPGGRGRRRSHRKSDILRSFVFARWEGFYRQTDPPCPGIKAASRPASHTPPLRKKRNTVTKLSADRAVVAEEMQHPVPRASRSGPTAALRHRGRNSGLAHSPALPGGGRTSFAALDNALPPCPYSASSTNWPIRSALAFRRSQELGILTVTRELVCLLFHPRRPLSVRLVVCRKRGRGRKSPEQV
ncbi:uncharacterized protein ACBT57_023386 isoform 1-T4 [Dama dama]